MNDPFANIAEQAHFNIYLSSIWTNTGRRFAEQIVQECANVCMSRADRNAILTRFGLPVPSDVKYPASPVKNSVESQYRRDLQISTGLE
jgi:hypothetical protein